MKLAAIHAGTAYHCEALEGPRYAKYFDRLLRPEALSTEHLQEYDILLVTCRTPAHRIAMHRSAIRQYLEHGGTVVAMGETGPGSWLQGVSFRHIPTNWWWWLEPGASLGLTIAQPDHDLFGRIGSKDIAWHLHGSFQPPLGTTSLIETDNQRSVLYVDEITTPGRMIVTSLDPFYHHGSHFMPATTRFLDGFLPWLKEDLVPVAGER